jgi:glycosyltransferase involved in cell wall biosynthesis
MLPLTKARKEYLVSGLIYSGFMGFTSEILAYMQTSPENQTSSCQETHIPNVSIGMPVYNGEKHIRQALDSLLAQNYGNFELVISDNASTDGTQEICHEYAMRDRRIRYYRNRQNMGAAWNFNRVLELSKGEYFMWAADDDGWERDYTSTLLSVISQFPESIVSFSNYMKYSEDGDFLGNEELTGAEVCEMAFRELIAMVFSLQKINVALYGLFRREELRTLLKDGFPDCSAPDRVIFAHFALAEKTVTLTNKYLYRRTIHSRPFAARDLYTLQHSKSNAFLRTEVARLRYYGTYVRLLATYRRRHSMNNVLYFSRKLTRYVIMVELLYMWGRLQRVAIALIELSPWSTTIKAAIKRVLRLLGHR